MDKNTDKDNLNNVPWLDKEKKEKFRRLKGSASSKVDLNKMREELKYGKNEETVECTSC